MPRNRNSLWALFAAISLTLLLGVMATGILAILQGQDTQATVATDHGQTLSKISSILDLKNSSVKAITNGQNVIVGYLVSNNADGKAICEAIPSCKLPKS